MTRARLAVALIITGMGAPIAWAGGNGSGHGHSATADQTAQNQDSGQLSFFATITATERQTILGYFQQHQAAYAGAKPLPPGIAKKLARGGTMPPGIAKRYFPNDLIAQLPPRPGQQWVIAGTDVLLVQTATNVIVDLLTKAF